MKKEKKEKRSILPGVIIVSLLVAAVVYAVLLNAEKTALSDYEKGSVYVTTKPVPKGTLITADYITQKEVDKSLIPSGAVSNPEDLTDLISVYAVDQGSIITTGMFTAVNDITKDMTQPVVQSLANTDDNWTDASSDTAASLVWGNVFVQEVFDSAGAVISTSDSTTPAQRVNIYMDNDNVAAFYAALAQGSLRVVKICE
ncbi:MAG: SAF domain-containing protein [Roseburia sp.]|nr:SAF domain-containing protein [Roseburia sp.]